jgi:hypothetical protein
MTLVQFKFKKTNAPARLAHFDAQPSWGDLASKIAKLFDTPPKTLVSLSSTKPKTQSLSPTTKSFRISTSHFNQSSEEIKFVVQDLQTPDRESAFC